MPARQKTGPEITTPRKRAKRAKVVPPHIGPALRAARVAAGKTIPGLAAELGLSRGHLSMVEQGKANMSLPEFLAYCDAIPVSPGAILELYADSDALKLKDLFATLLKRAGLPALRWLAALSRAEIQQVVGQGEAAVAYDRHRKRRAPGSTPRLQ